MDIVERVFALQRQKYMLHFLSSLTLVPMSTSASPALDRVDCLLPLLPSFHPLSSISPPSIAALVHPQQTLLQGLSRPRNSAEPHTPTEAFLQSSRPLPVPPPCCSLFRSVECGVFLLIVTMFPFCLWLLFPSIPLCYPLPLFLL